MELGRDPDRRKEAERNLTARTAHWRPIRAALCAFTLTADMQVRLVLEAEHGIRTEYGPVTLFARKDVPPSITFKSKEDLLPVNVNVPETVGDVILLLARRVIGPAKVLELELLSTPPLSASPCA